MRWAFLRGRCETKYPPTPSPLIEQHRSVYGHRPTPYTRARQTSIRWPINLRISGREDGFAGPLSGRSLSPRVRIIIFYQRRGASATGRRSTQRPILFWADHRAVQIQRRRTVVGWESTAASRAEVVLMLRVAKTPRRSYRIGQGEG